MNKVTTYNFLV